MRLANLRKSELLHHSALDLAGDIKFINKNLAAISAAFFYVKNV